MLDKLYSIIRWKELSLRIGRCPICGISILLKFSNNYIGMRCIRCGGSGVHLAMAKLLSGEGFSLGDARVYELSARGPLVDFLRRTANSLTCSEYFEQVERGAWVNGVQCQDVQDLTYPDECFDLCTSTEVFEHVPDDRRGFKELFRVLRPGGQLVFTIPLSSAPKTVERAILTEDGIRHILPPEYHGDRQRGFRGVLVYRDYGRDVCERLLDAGFASARISPPPPNEWWGLGGNIVIGQKALQKGSSI